MAQKIITILLGIAVVAALVWYVNKNYVQPTSATNAANLQPTPGSSTNAQSPVQINDLYFVTKQAATEIWRMDSKGKTKKVFTDADEAGKIIKLSNVASSTGEVVAVTSSGGSQKLVDISLYDAKEKVLKDSFPSASNLSISSDGNYISYTKFSNVEDSYGYTLYYEEKSGKGIKQITQSATELINPSWCSGDTIAYGVTQGTKTDIKVFNVSGKSEKTILSLDDKVLDFLSCNGDDITAATRNLGKTDSGAISLVKSSGLSNIVNFSGGKAGYIYGSGSRLAYILAQYQNKIDTSISGQIYIYDSETAKKSGVQKGIQVLGWALAR